MQLGYTPLNKFSFCLIGSALQQNVNSINGYGFGYGVGSDFIIVNNISLSINHKIYDMTSEYKEYDYKTTSVSLIYKF